jgi:hypothetical protein
MRERQSFPIMDGGECDHGQSPLSILQGTLANRMREMRDLNGYSGRDGGEGAHCQGSGVGQSGSELEVAKGGA